MLSTAGERVNKSCLVACAVVLWNLFALPMLVSGIVLATRFRSRLGYLLWLVGLFMIVMEILLCDCACVWAWTTRVCRREAQLTARHPSDPIASPVPTPEVARLQMEEIPPPPVPRLRLEELPIPSVPHAHPVLEARRMEARRIGMRTGHESTSDHDS